eukprot:CAMPEP_0181256920 /NCGR_PEP_ID=MMETSP1096-20121128/49974_1 /TAXON_ID=156174 ORGANISM="Chrysochromulina ericina, Strain CCMP281" /NCGR_SAMPLE_ID=MMETSP1096 /ASSEMBLY_ACC=CAM_ASM_000453 /LENGTH=39 /DNA_ID= /DNA_START= /DNA_END= /DNA_ORIENTATION=
MNQASQATCALRAWLRASWPSSTSGSPSLGWDASSFASA